MMRNGYGKSVRKAKFALGLMLVLILVSGNTVFAMEQYGAENRLAGTYEGSICIENEKTGEISEFPMTLLKTNGQIRTYSEDDSVTETYEAVLEIDKEGNVRCVDYVPPMTRTEASASDSNTYWKASISITYSVNSTTANLTKVSGSWTQLRGNTTLSDRYVYYAINGGNVGNSGEQRPSTNTFSYNTGFASISSSRLYSIGANSRATVTTEAGLSLTLTTNVEKRYTS